MIKVPEFLRSIFSDPRFHFIAQHRMVGSVDGVRNGIALATKSPKFDTFALNMLDNEKVLEAKRNGKIDQAFVVAARRNGSWQLEYCVAVEAEEFQTVLARQPFQTGKYGDFWTLYPSAFSDDEWEM